jgi:predicted nucleic acid-binding protein
MRHLVDANVLREPTRPVPDQRAVTWLGAREGDLVVDPIVLGEMSAGILALPRGKKRVRLEGWFGDVVRGIDCVPCDAEVGLRWARLVTDLRKKGRGMPLLDSLIAAPALRYGFTVATRNVRHFELAGVDVVDPFV